ncbi:MAG: glycosyltransferase [Candidatus Omnitrophota bacterium]
MVSIILPVFKTSVFLEQLIDEIHHSLDAARYEHEIVAVHDRCPEGSLAELEKIAARDNRLIVIDLKLNVGQHKAVLTGMAYSRGDWIGVMDADRQDQPELLPLMLTMARRENAVVFAGRRGQYESPARLVTSKIFKHTLAAVIAIPADAGMFFVMPGIARDSILNMRIAKPFVTVMIGALPLRKLSYPAPRRKREAGRSGYSSLQRVCIGLGAVVCALQCRFHICRRGKPDYTDHVRAVTGKNRNGSLA